MLGVGKYEKLLNLKDNCICNFVLNYMQELCIYLNKVQFFFRFLAFLPTFYKMFFMISKS